LTIGDVTPDPFDALVDELPSAALVLTLAAGGEHGGCLVAFATQCTHLELVNVVVTFAVGDTSCVPVVAVAPRFAG
jgi:hypothetical protein